MKHHKVYVTILKGILICTFMLLVLTNVAVAQRTLVLRLGFITDLTSYLSINGIPSRNAAMLAVQQGGKIDGTPVELIVEDDASNPDLAVQKAKKLVEVDKVNMILGPFHGGSNSAVGAYLAKVGVPHLMISYNLNFLREIKQFRWSFAPWGSGEQLGYAVGAFVADHLGMKTGALISTDYIFPRGLVHGFKEAFEERGGKIVHEAWIPLETKDVTPYVIGLPKTDFILAWFAGVLATSGFKQIRSVRPDVPIISPQSQFPAEPKQIVDIGEAGVGVITAEPYVWHLPGKVNAEFRAAYKAAYGIEPSGAAGRSYYTTKIALEVLRRARGKLDPAYFKQILTSTCFSGPIREICSAESGLPKSVVYFIHKVIKRNGTYTTEILRYYEVAHEYRGDNIVPRVIESWSAK